MFLSIDAGNSSITLGLYAGDTLKGKYRMATNRTRTFAEYGQELAGFLKEHGAARQNLTGAGIFSVVPHVMEDLSAAVGKHLNGEPFILEKCFKTGIDFGRYKCGELGADRIVDAAAAFSKFGGGVLIIDLGTATTYDAVSSKGKYLGGAIAPGIRISAEALWARAAKLPEVRIEKPESVFGENTVCCMQSGIFLGYIGQIEYMVKKMKECSGENLKVIATGGFASLFKGCTDAIDIYDEDLTLWGIKYLYEINQKPAGLRPMPA